MRWRHCIMQVRNWKCCHIKLWRIIKELSISRAFNIICILVYCGLYTMTIDIVTWRIIKIWCIWSLNLSNFLCLPVFALFLKNYGGHHVILKISYIYIFKIEIRNKETYLPEGWSECFFHNGWKNLCLMITNWIMTIH